MMDPNDTNRLAELKLLLYKGIRCANCKKLGATKPFTNCGHWVCVSCTCEAWTTPLDFEKYRGLLENPTVGDEYQEKEEVSKTRNDDLRNPYRCPVRGCEAVNYKETLDWINDGGLPEQKLLVFLLAANKMNLYEKLDLCSMCRTQDCHINPASFACIECAQYLCEECFKLHNEKEPFKQHSILPSSDGLTHVLMSICKKHNDHQTYCCLDCYAPMCPSCVVRDVNNEDENQENEVHMAIKSDSYRHMYLRQRSSECKHKNVHTLNEEENTWKINGSFLAANDTIQKNILKLQEQLKIIESYFDEATKTIDGTMQDLSNLLQKLKKQKDDLDEKFTSLKEIFSDQIEKLSNRSFLHQVVINSPVARSCLPGEWMKTIELETSEIVQASEKQFQISIQLPEIVPLQIAGGEVRYMAEEDMKASKHSRKSPSVDELSESSSSAGSNHTYESIPSSQLSSGYASILSSSYRKLLSTSSSHSYQDLLSRSSLSSLDSKQPTSPTKLTLPAASKEPKPMRARHGKSVWMPNNTRSIRRSDMLSRRAMEKNILAIWKEPAVLRLVRKISKFHSGTLCY